MEFFKRFSELVPGADIQLTIKEKNGTFAVQVLPNLGTKKNISPLLVNGTAIELDQEFFRLISEPLQKAAALVTNAKEFAESVQDAVKPEPAKEEKKKDYAAAKKAASKKSIKKPTAAKKKEEKKPDPVKEVADEGPKELSMF